VTQSEWIDRCANRFIERSRIDKETARSFAEACYEMRKGFFDDEPEDAADSDMSYWEA
jgi:hypothetical protein